MSVWQVIALVLGAYLLGAVPAGYLVVRHVRGEDIRRYGSGNIGATNVGRLMGRRWGVAVWFLDSFKGFAPCFMAGLLTGHHWGDFTLNLTVVVCGLAAVIGHMFPVYLGFRGGKGVSTSCGVFLYLFPQGFLIAAAVWGLVVALLRYVSLASILAALTLAGAALLLPDAPLGASKYLTGVSVLAAALVIARHASNISRLIRGTENKVGSQHPFSHGQDRKD